jgi:hypothetical protein
MNISGGVGGILRGDKKKFIQLYELGLPPKPCNIGKRVWLLKPYSHLCSLSVA